MSDLSETLLRIPTPVMAEIGFADADDETCLSPLPVRPICFELIPADADSGLNSIYIEQPPLWISREIGPLAKYRKSCPEKAKFLSRQHAYLYCEDRQVYLKDLGSTNGTELNGKKVSANKPHLLCDGDCIVFGYAFFNFIFKLSQTPEAFHPVHSQQAGSANDYRQNQS